MVVIENGVEFKLVKPPNISFGENTTEALKQLHVDEDLNRELWHIHNTYFACQWPGALRGLLASTDTLAIIRVTEAMQLDCAVRGASVGPCAHCR